MELRGSRRTLQFRGGRRKRGGFLIASITGETFLEPSVAPEKAKAALESEGSEERAHHLELFLEREGAEAADPGELTRSVLARSPVLWVHLTALPMLLGPGLALGMAAYGIHRLAGFLTSPVEYGFFLALATAIQTVLQVWFLLVMPVMAVLVAGAGRDLLERLEPPDLATVVRKWGPRMLRVAGLYLLHLGLFLGATELLMACLPVPFEVALPAFLLTGGWAWLHVIPELVDPEAPGPGALLAGYAAALRNLRLPRKALSDPLSRSMLACLLRTLVLVAATLVFAGVGSWLGHALAMQFLGQGALWTAAGVLLFPGLLATIAGVHVLNRTVLEWSYFRLALRARLRSGPATVRRLRQLAGGPPGGRARWRRLA